MAHQSVSADQIHQFLAYGALGFGVAGILAPGALRHTYGMDTDSAELAYFGRMWGSRTAVIGVLALAADSAESRRLVATLAMGSNAADAVVAATTKGLPRRTRVLGALTSGAFAGAAAYALTLD